MDSSCRKSLLASFGQHLKRLDNHEGRKAEPSTTRPSVISTPGGSASRGIAVLEEGDVAPQVCLPFTDSGVPAPESGLIRCPGSLCLSPPSGPRPEDDADLPERKRHVDQLTPTSTSDLPAAHNSTARLNRSPWSNRYRRGTPCCSRNGDDATVNSE